MLYKTVFSGLYYCFKNVWLHLTTVIEKGNILSSFPYNFSNTFSSLIKLHKLKDILLPILHITVLTYIFTSSSETLPLLQFSTMK